METLEYTGNISGNHRIHRNHRIARNNTIVLVRGDSPSQDDMGGHWPAVRFLTAGPGGRVR